MSTAHVVVSVLLAVALAGCAAADFARSEQILVAMAQAGVPESWLPMLGTLKAAGALGVLAGLFAPAVGVAAAAGVIAYFGGAVVAHLRARDHGFAPAGVFGLMAVATLLLGIAAL
jgi:DoxX-like family